jgi:hypothetical protein
MAWVNPSTVATGDVLTASTWNQDVTENTAQLYASQRRLAIVTRASNTTVATTANLTAPNELFTTDLTFTALAATEYIVEVYISYVQTASNAGSNVQVYITNGSTTGIALVGALGNANGTQTLIAPMFIRYRYTPGAGSITLNVAGVHGTAAGVIGSASVNYPPSHLAVYGPDLT